MRRRSTGSIEVHKAQPGTNKHRLGARALGCLGQPGCRCRRRRAHSFSTKRKTVRKLSARQPVSLLAPACSVDVWWEAWVYREPLGKRSVPKVTPSTWYARWAQTENTGEHGCTGAHGLSLSLGEEQVHRQQKLAATCLWADELCGFPDFSYEGCRTVVVLPLLIALIAALSWNGTTEASS